jgi:Ca-activated chloride channel family protein
MRERRRVRAVAPRATAPKRTLARAAILLLLANVSFGASPGLEAYRQNKFSEARQEFEKTLKEHPQTGAADKLEFDAGAAAYKMQDFGKALNSFSQALLSPDAGLQGKSHYNLGNTLYQRGETQKKDDEKLKDWTNALQHYEQTLKITPDNKEAKENLEYVKRKIEELKQKREQQPSPSPSPPPQEKKKGDKKDDSKKDDKNQQQQQDQQKQDEQKQSDQKDQSGKDDQQKPDKGDDQSQAKNESGKDKKDEPGADQNAAPSPGSDDQADQNRSSPSPQPSPQNSEKPDKQDQQNSSTGDQEKPDQSPVPSDQENQSPSPAPGTGEEPDTSPSPGPSPGKKLAGEVKGAGDEKPNQTEQNAQMAEAEPEKEGQMSEKQAELLLQSMKDEERRVQLDERKVARHVYNDW